MISEDMRYFYWDETEYVYVCAMTEEEAIEAILDEISEYLVADLNFPEVIVLKEMHRFDPVSYEFNPNSGEDEVSFYDHVKDFDGAQVLFVDGYEVFCDCGSLLRYQGVI